MTTWDVEVLRGKTVELEEDIPMEFGTPVSYVGDDGTTSAPGVNLIYSRVGLRVVPGKAWLFIRRDDGTTRNFRYMEHLSGIEIDWDGSLTIYGMEERSDGALVTASWRAEPHYPTREEFEATEALLKGLFGPGD